MSKSRIKRKRSRGLVLLLLPALIFIGLVGWLICALEPQSSKPAKGIQAPTVKGYGDGVTFMPAVYEDQAIIKKS